MQTGAMPPVPIYAQERGAHLQEVLRRYQIPCLGRPRQNPFGYRTPTCAEQDQRGQRGTVAYSSSR